MEPFLGHVMLEHAVMTLQQMSHVVSEVPSRTHGGLLRCPADGRRAHNFEDPALRLGDFEAPILEIMLRAKRPMSRPAHLL